MSGREELKLNYFMPFEGHGGGILKSQNKISFCDFSWRYVVLLAVDTPNNVCYGNLFASYA